MQFRYTNHAIEKFLIMKAAGFPLSKQKIQQAIVSPLKEEHQPDGTIIASSLYNRQHVLRIVYRVEPQ